MSYYFQTLQFGASHVGDTARVKAQIGAGHADYSQASVSARAVR